MALPLAPDLAPMEATAVDEIPATAGWQYEPKWDGFRCLAFRDGAAVELRSKSGQPLGRYFPDLIAVLAALPARRFVLDGEIVTAVDDALSFDALLQRIHPAASRVAKLAAAHPATYLVFDLLADGRRTLVDVALRERRAALEVFAATKFPPAGAVRLSPATTDRRVGRRWFGAAGTATDGVIAKRLDLPYAAGTRSGMVKVKPTRTADCVIGGFRYADKRRVVGSLLLGLYDDEGRLHHVGFCSGIKTAERVALTRKLEALMEPPGFTGRAPGGPSRWSTKRSMAWQPLRPVLVAEVSFDHVTGGRFRHGTSLLRWRPDKAPRQCTLAQIAPPPSRAWSLVSAPAVQRKRRGRRAGR